MGQLSRTKIKELLKEDTDVRKILMIIHKLNLKDCWLCAGCLRNFIWNHLSNQKRFDHDTDVDIIFFDPEISYEETLKLERKLYDEYPQYRWEVKNQVYMHLHSPETAPYKSSRDAISKFPETCTAIGGKMLKDGTLELFAPYGLADIIEFEIRPTPYFAQNPERRKIYHQRVAEKNWCQKWPQIKVVTDDELGKMLIHD